MNNLTLPTLSVIFSTHNEVGLGFLKRSLDVISQIEGVEVICVDGLSTDGTWDLIKSYDVKAIKTDLKLRSQRFNLGFESAKGKIILFHHPRSILNPESYIYLIDNADKLTWGGFKHKFDEESLLLRFTSWYSNTIRFKTQSIIYLDHCLYLNKKLAEKIKKPLWPEVDIFEDTDFCIKLRSIAKPKILPFQSITSAIRFKKNGTFKQSYMNQVLKLFYLLGMSREAMNKWYERKISLNTKYDV